MSGTPLGPFPHNSWTVSAAHADMVRPVRPAQPIDLGALPKPVRIDAARTAILVIDMQNDFCHPDGWLASIGVDVRPARAPVAPLQALLPVARDAGVPIVWVNWGTRPDRTNLSPALRHVYDPTGAGTGLGDPSPPRQSPTLQAGSWGAAIVEDLVPAPQDLHVAKHRMSGFWDSPLDAILRQMQVTTLLFAGVNADQCVLHTLADANFLGFDTVLIEDATATTSPSFCMEATLYNVRQIFGFTVASPALIAALAAMTSAQSSRPSTLAP